MTEAEWLSSTDPAAMLGYLRGSDWADTSHEWNCRISPRRLRLFACACCRAVWPLLTDARSRRAVEVAERYADGLATEIERAHAWEQAVEVGLDRDSLAFSAARCAENAKYFHLTPKIVLDSTSRHMPPATQAALLRDICGNPWVVVEREHDAKPGYPTCWRRKENPGPSRRLLTVKDSWLTPTVIALATAAYSERAGRKCERCKGMGTLGFSEAWDTSEPTCPDCRGSGHIDDGALEADRLAVLADALEEAGCPEYEKCHDCQDESPYRIYCDTCKDSGRCGKLPHPLLAHLRSPGPHVRGCWAIDLLLGKE